MISLIHSYSKVKEVDLAFYLPEVQAVFSKNSSFFKKFYEAVKEYPADDPSS